MYSERLHIDLRTLTDGTLEYTEVLDESFFDGLDDAQIRKGRVDATVSIRRAGSDGFTMKLGVEGIVTVQCDLCLDDMDQPVSGESEYIVRLRPRLTGSPISDNRDADGEQYEDDVITVDEEEGILNLEWLIYELTVLAIPIKHVHAPGKCNDAMTKKLEELSATRSGDEDAGDAVDPRWSVLGELRTKN